MVVKVEIAPVCVEHRIYDKFDLEWVDDPYGLGHEGVGAVVDVSEGASFQVGDRVIIYQADPCGVCWVCKAGLGSSHCLRFLEVEKESSESKHVPGAFHYIEAVNGSESGGFGMVQYRISHERQLQRIPHDLDFRYAAAANCSLGCTYTAVEEAGVAPGDFVLICGVGFIGLGALINAKYRNATVIVMGRNEYRMQMAREMGADYVLNPEDPDWLARLREITGEYRGVQFSFECSGFPYYQERALQALTMYGHLHFMGHNNSPDIRLSLHVLRDVIDRHISMAGGHDVRHRDRSGLLRMLCDKEIQAEIDRLVTHEYPMTQARDAFETALTKKCGKIYLHPHLNVC